MKHRDRAQFELPGDEKIRKGRKNAEKRLGARDIVRRAAWLEWPLVYWTGSADGYPRAEKAGYRPISEVMALALRARAPGLYAVRLKYAAPDPAAECDPEQRHGLVNPTIELVGPVTGKLIATTAFAVKLADRYPKALPRILDNVDAWRGRAEKGLNTAGALFPTVAALGARTPEAMALEELCLWLGPDDARPSTLLGEDALADWLHNPRNTGGPGMRAAAIALARKNPNVPLPQALTAWAAAARRFPQWPADLLCRCGPQPGQRQATFQLVPHDAAQNASLIRLVLLEYVLAGEKPALAALLRALSPVLHALDRYTHELERRTEVFVEGSKRPPRARPDAREAAMAGWQHSVAGLIARHAGGMHLPESTAHFVTVLDLCRERCAPGPDGFAGLRSAVAALETGIVFAREQSGGLPRCLEGLGLLEESIVNEADGDTHRRRMARAVLLLAQAPGLSMDMFRLILERGLVRDAASFLPRRVGALMRFVHWLARLEEAGALGAAHDWLRIFQRDEPKVERALTRWADQAATRGLLSWNDASVCVGAIDFHLYGSSGEQRKMCDFLARNMWIADQLAAAATHRERRRPTIPHQIKGGWPELCKAFEDRAGIFEILFLWEQAGYGGKPRLAAAILEHCERLDEAAMRQRRDGPPTYFAHDTEDRRLAALLAGGDAARLTGLLRAKSDCQRYPDSALKGWQALHELDGVKEFLRECAKRTEWIERMLALLQQIALVARLQSADRLNERLRAWTTPAAADAAAWPAGLNREIRGALIQLQAYRKMGGQPDALPPDIQKVLDRPHLARRELDALQRRAESADPGPSAAKRRRNLEALLADPAAMNASICDGLAKVYPKQLQMAKLTALEQAVQATLLEHWQAVLPGVEQTVNDPDWHNALVLYRNTRTNKRLLRDLLRALTTGDRDWAVRHPKNQAFLRKVSTAPHFEPAVWLKGFRRRYAMKGKPWTAHIETDPLKILQMGNLFDTCLSVDQYNAFSTVANAVEINKRVLYLKDGDGRTIGRKLVALSAQGVLFGFRSYGGGRSEVAEEGSLWVKILFDLFCLELARKTHARFPSEKERQALLKDPDEHLKLFAQWYFDGLEPFDWWIELERDKPETTRAHIARALCVRLARADPGKHVDRDTLRCLLYLGDWAADPLREARERFTVDQLGVLAQHTHSAAVRELLKA
ncbi:MAG: hypothetical protein JXR37_23505 [Kiritimatiellae bacterium]|nr:hypothetical protein [Kiritimatiellia bacterium]